MYLGHPAFVYAAVWLIVLGLVYAGLTTFLLRLAPVTVWLVLGNIGTFVVISLWMRWSSRGMRFASLRQIAYELAVLRRFVRKVLKVWIVGSIFEILVAPGVPLLWLAMDDTSRNYQDFGIPTLHGLLTAMYLIVLVGLFIEYCLRPRTRRGQRALAMIGVLFVWPVLQVNRGVGVWALLQLLGVYLLVRRVRVSTAIRAAAVLLAAILAFGVMGDLRSPRSAEALHYSVAPGAQYMHALPSGFLWVYLYVATPLNNVNRALREDMRPDGQLYFSTINLLPSVVRPLVYNDPDRQFPVQLVNTAFTTSTWYAGFLADFGIWWAATAAALLQACAAWMYVRARRRHLWAMLAYAALFQGLALSIFADTFTSLVTLGQVAIAFYFRGYVRAVAARQARRRPASSPRLVDRPRPSPA